MRIKELFVSQYKNISDINVTFNSSISLLVGQNGLGKSNLIEILSIIFSELYLAEKEGDIVDLLGKEGYFGYRISYMLGENSFELRLDEKLNSFQIYSNDEEVSFNAFKRNREHYLPCRIVGYYSGENKRILSILAPHIEKVKDIQNKRVNVNSRLRQIFFSENYHSQLILLTLIIYKEVFHQKAEGRFRLADKLLEQYLGIQNIDGFTVRFNNPDDTVYKKKGIDTLGSGFGHGKEDTFWGLKGSPHKLIGILFDKHINEFIAYLNDTDDKGDKVDSRAYVKEILEFPETKINDIRDEIIKVFPHPLDFFDALESSYVLGVLGQITINVNKTGVNIPINFEQLSEGEQQLVTVIGMILLASDESNLFLLDEPDTHINPKWQREYVQLIRDVLSPAHQSHVFIATHSPFLVQSYDNEDLLLFRREDQVIKIDTEDHKISNWRLDHVLMSPYFDLPSARPSSLDEFMKRRLEIIEKGDINNSDRNELKRFENEYGYLPTGETYLEVETQIILQQIAKQEGE